MAKTIHGLISYSHADSTFVDKLFDRLQFEKIALWRDIHDLAAGNIERQLTRAIEERDFVVLVLSSNSLKSDWVWLETHTARTLAATSDRQWFRTGGKLRRLQLVAPVHVGRSESCGLHSRR